MTMDFSEKEINCISFNQDHGCFVCGTSSGFEVYASDPVKLIHSRELPTGVRLIRMLLKSALYSFVGTGSHSMFPSNKVVIWDDTQERSLGELTFRLPVVALGLRNDRIVISTQRKVYVYLLANLTQELDVPICEQSKGLFAMSYEGERFVPEVPLILAYPLPEKGVVEVVKLPAIARSALGRRPSSSRSSQFTVQAHQSMIVHMSMSSNGTRFATSSEKGTIIRIFDAETGAFLCELRRGSERAVLCCSAFNADCSMVAITSDKSTVHIFRIDAEARRDRAMTDGVALGLRPANSSDQLEALNAAEEVQQPRSASTRVTTSNTGSKTLQRIGNLMPTKTVQDYFDSQGSFAKIRDISAMTVCEFLPETNLLVLASQDRTYRLCAMGLDQPPPSRGSDSMNDPNVPARADGECAILVRSMFPGSSLFGPRGSSQRSLNSQQGSRGSATSTTQPPSRANRMSTRFK